MVPLLFCQNQSWSVNRCPVWCKNHETRYPFQRIEFRQEKDDQEPFFIDQNDKECENGVLQHSLWIQQYSCSILVSGCRNYPKIHGLYFTCMLLPRASWSCYIHIHDYTWVTFFISSGLQGALGPIRSSRSIIAPVRRQSTVLISETRPTTSYVHVLQPQYTGTVPRCRSSFGVRSLSRYRSSFWNS